MPHVSTYSPMATTALLPHILALRAAAAAAAAAAASASSGTVAVHHQSPPDVLLPNLSVGSSLPAVGHALHAGGDDEAGMHKRAPDGRDSSTRCPVRPSPPPSVAAMAATTATASESKHRKIKKAK